LALLYLDAWRCRFQAAYCEDVIIAMPYLLKGGRHSTNTSGGQWISSLISGVGAFKAAAQFVHLKLHIVI
jgi:hypothetical protein